MRSVMINVLVNKQNTFRKEDFCCSNYIYQVKFHIKTFGNSRRHKQLRCIANWVNRFRAAGPDALKTRSERSKENIDKPQIDSDAEERIVDTSAEHIRELEDELPS